MCWGQAGQTKAGKPVARIATKGLKAFEDREGLSPSDYRIPITFTLERGCMLHELAIAESYAVWDGTRLGTPWKQASRLDGWERGRLDDQIRKGVFVVVGYDGMFAEVIVCRPGDTTEARQYIKFNSRYRLHGE